MKSIGTVIVAVGMVLALSRVSGQEAIRPEPGGISTMTSADVYQLPHLPEEHLQAFISILEATPTISAENLPNRGMAGAFFSLQNPSWPPLPGDVNDNAVWQGDDFYLLDDIGFDYSTAGQARFHARRRAADGSLLSTGDGVQAEDVSSGGMMPPGGGTNSFSSDVVTNDSPSVIYGTNLWIAQVHILSTNLLAIATNTLADVQYEIMSWTNLAQPANWVSQGFIWGSETTNWTPLNPLPASQTNNLFIGLRSWADDGSGLPIWWQLQYFGHVGVDPNADPAGDGWSNIQKFQLGWNPNLFYTPPAPQGLTITYNTSGIATVSWLPSPGPVTGYTVTVKNYDTGENTNFTVSATTTSIVENLSAQSAADIAEGWPQLWVDYSIAANYGANGSSALGSATLEDNNSTPVSAVFRGWQGNICLVLPGLPADLSAVNIYRQSVLGNVDGIPDLADGVFAIPATSITNGIVQIPATQVLPTGSYNFSVQTVRSNGISSNWSDPYMSHDYEAMPFVDERSQIKDNLRFMLRAANQHGPFTVGQDSTWYSGPLNYIYSSGGYRAYLSGTVFNVFKPTSDNYFYRNFVFDQNNLDGTGFLNTGCSYGGFIGFDNCSMLFINDNPTYDYNVANYIISSVAPTSLLNTNQTTWILNPIEVPIVTDQNNFFGLPYLSVTDAYATNNEVNWATFDFNPNFPIPSGCYYYQVAQPVFQRAGYYFARPVTDPMPEQGGFSPTNTTPLMIQGLGNPVTIAGYAQLAVQNSSTGVPCYLGQYFDQAYQIDANGNITVNPTGILSPYGDFFPTQPGPVALVTMPDIDPPYQRGTCTVYAVSLQLDANHDGTMDLSFNGTDATSPNSPYVFWCNNNYDRWATNSGFVGLYTDVEQDDQQIAFSPAAPTTPTPDCNYSNVLTDGYAYRAIPCTRDLEDFARLWVCGITTNLLAQLPSASTVTLSWGEVGNPNSGNPTIDLFTAADPDGGIGYQTNETVATAQINPIQSPYIGRLAPGGSIQLNASQFANSWAGNHLIWCGVNYGSGWLTLTIADGSGNTLAQTTAYIQIVDIKQMYERYTVGDNSNTNPLTAPLLASEGLPVGVPSLQYPLPQNTNTPYILHVHGYNMPTWSKDRYAETEYKRLYWQGYQGRFGSFRWPTTVQNFSFSTILSDAQAFDLSEANAWASWKGLLNLLTNLDKTYGAKNVYLTAHSHGNEVAGEALRQATQQGLGQVVNTYVAMQAAVDSHTYDATTLTRPLMPSYSTPDRYGQYYTNGAPCYFNGASGAGTYVNFFNTNDWALNNLWELDQNEKPDNGYAYSANPDTWWAYGVFSSTIFTFPTNTYTIFAYIDQGHSFALGMQPNVGGPFLKGSAYNQINLPSVWPPDLSGENYGAHIWHSAEFRSDNPQRWQFWNSALTQMKLK